ncbi:hypothetical protein [Methylomonas sp. ZR1]|nr:hypothetical protein [Methylomonas sp. ZR1]
MSIQQLPYHLQTLVRKRDGLGFIYFKQLIFIDLYKAHRRRMYQ